jgi:hypothetical protein
VSVPAETTVPPTPAVDARGRRAAPTLHPGERPVFAATDGRRARRLRIVALVAAGLVALWLVALVAGILGFGRLPLVPDVRPSTAAPKAVPHWKRPSAAPSAAATRRIPARGRSGRAARGAIRGAGTRSPGAASRRSTNAPRSVRRTPAGTRRAAGGTPAASAPNTTSGQRVGQTGIAPPTSSRPASPPGQQRRSTLTTTDSTVSPGQGVTHRAYSTR